jgi:hypothetical protein
VDLNGDHPTTSIAITGMSCRFPGAPDVETYGRNVRRSVESIAFLSEPELRVAGVADELLSDPAISDTRLSKRALSPARAGASGARWTASSDGHRVEFVEIHGREQRQQMLQLLREGFPRAGFDWSRAFKAPPGRSGHGLLLVEDGVPQGGILAFEKMEMIGGRDRRFVNLSSWYIRPNYRRVAVRMMRAVSSDPDTIYTGVSPIRSVQTICLRAGWRYVSRGSIASIPLLNGLAAGRVSVTPFRPGGLQGDHEPWMIDHVDAGHIGLVVRQRERTATTLWMQGLKMKKWRAARLLFASDCSLLRAALPAIHAHMLRQHRIVGLYLPHVAAFRGLRSIGGATEGPSVIVKGDIADQDVNLLYSEYFYLPL